MTRPRASYRHDGAIGVEGFVLVFVFGMFAAVLLGALHGVVPFVVPREWTAAASLTLLLLGVAVGAVVGTSGRLGRVRSPLFLGLMGLLLGFVALYAAWAAHLTWLIRASATEEAPAPVPFVIAPDTVWRGIFGLAVLPVQAGVAEPDSIYTSLAVWAVEALVLLLLPAAVAGAWLRGLPYCDRTNTWCDLKEVIAPFVPAPDAEALRGALQAGDLEALLALPAQDPSSPLYTQAVIRSAPGERGSHYLTVWTVEPPAHWPGGRPPGSALPEPAAAAPEPTPSGDATATSEAAPAPQDPPLEFFDRYVPVKNQRPLRVVKNMLLTRLEYEKLKTRAKTLQEESAALEARSHAAPAAPVSPPAP